MSIYLTSYLAIFGYSVATSNWWPLIVVIGILFTILVGLGLWDRWTDTFIEPEK